MKKIQFAALFILSGVLFTRCTNNADPSATSTVSLKMSAATTNGKTSFSGRTQAAIALTDVKVNVREIEFEFEFDHDDDRFKKDSCFNQNSDLSRMGMSAHKAGNDDHEAKLKGPFIVDLLDAGAFVDQVITSVEVPNAEYEKIKFKLSPSSEAGDMKGKSVLIKGTIGSTPFTFWHDARARFGVKFSDSTSLATNGPAVTLAIQLELDKVMSTVNGGVDLSKAKDGNSDGTITIDPDNTDGNEKLADDIMKLLTRHARCEKKRD